MALLNLKLGTVRTEFHRSRRELLPVQSPPERVRAGLEKNRMNAADKKIITKKKPEICTADELHYVDVANSEWKIALWRYLPSPKAQPKNHPLFLLPGVATNAIGFDLCPQSSFARFMSTQGFDTWILELRGIGLSSHIMDSKSDNLRSKLLKSVINFPERVSGFLDGGQNSFITSLSRDFSQKLLNFIEESQHYIRPSFFYVHERTPVDEFLEQLEQIEKYDWDFDHYLEEDLPAAMEYIRIQCKPKDGKLLAIGHSMGGILLYSLLSRCSFQGRESGLASVTTLGSSLDYTSSQSTLKLILPIADPARALNIPAIPIGEFMSAIHPLVCHPPYILSRLTHQFSSPGMMDPQLFEKLVLNNFCTVPAKLLLQLATAFQEGGLQSRNGTIYYKDHLGKSNVPILAVAGDHDLICPPEAVYGTVKAIPEHLVRYEVFGKSNGPHYAHYDIVGGRQAAHQVYPCIIDFLDFHDV